MAKPIKLDMRSICGGALEEVFNHELQRVCENIADPNTKTDAPRKIMCSVTIKPDPKGRHAMVSFDVKSALQNVQTEGALVHIAADEQGHLGLFTVDVRQQELPLPVEEIRPVSTKPSPATPSKSATTFSPPAQQ